MAISRADALKRLKGLSSKIEEHLLKIAENPGHSSIPHWAHEINVFIEQMEAVLPNVGKKTSAGWAVRIAQWKSRLGQ